MKHEDVVIILRDQADKLISSIPDYQLKFTAALTVILGWLISVGETRNYIANHATLFKPAIVIMLIGLGIIQAVWITHHYKQAELSYLDLKKYIDDHNLFDSDFIRPQFLGKHIVPTYIISNIFMLSAIGGVAVFA